MTDFDNDKPPVLDTKPVPPAAPRSSLIARLLNVIAMPGHVFEEVRVSRHSIGNWLIPLPLYAISFGLFAAVLFSTPPIQKLFNEMRPEWRKAQLEQLNERVKSKKITQADADGAMKVLDAIVSPEVSRAIIAGSGLAAGAARILWWSLVVWFLARVAMRAPVGFGKALEVVGLASVVAIVGNLAVVAVGLDFGKTFSSEGFKLTVNDFTAPGNQLVAALLQNGLNFWLIAVLGTGLARLTSQPWFRGAFLIAAYWIATDLLSLALSVGAAR